MYLIHNAYGTSLVIIKPNDSGGSAPSQLLDNSNVNVNDYSSRSSSGNVEDFYSNLTTTTTTSNATHKDDQHEETSRDYYNTHTEQYEWSTNIDLDDIFISVKTTKKFHDSRLKMLVKTWFQLAKEQVIKLLCSSIF